MGVATFKLQLRQQAIYRSVSVTVRLRLPVANFILIFEKPAAIFLVRSALYDDCLLEGATATQKLLPATTRLSQHMFWSLPLASRPQLGPSV
jgi:hypothetical protein